MADLKRKVLCPILHCSQSWELMEYSPGLVDGHLRESHPYEWGILNCDMKPWAEQNGDIAVGRAGA